MKKFSLVFFAMVLGVCVGLGPVMTALAQGDSTDTFMLEEVTVTAEKREVDVQKTALAVEAISGTEIKEKSISNVSDLLDTLTAVKVMGGPMGGKIFIRGIGSNIDTNLASPSVSLQKDNVYLGQSEAVMGSLYDIERVEVLYGPQGTMYGKNAAGGQVNVITKNPGDEFEASGSLTIGTYNLTGISAAVNVPFSSQWAARLAVDQQNHDGYIDDGSGSANKFGGRLKVSYKPTEKVSLLLTSEYTSDKSTNMNTVPVPGSAGNLPLMGAPDEMYGWTVPDEYNNETGDLGADGLADDELLADGTEGSNDMPDIVDTGWEQVVDGDPWSNDIYHPAPKNNSEYKTISLQADVDMGFSTLTIIPTLNKNKRLLWSNLIEGTSRGGDLQEQSFKEDQYSAEVRFSSPESSRLIWTVGGYWIRNDNEEINVVTTDLLDEAADTWLNGVEGRDSIEPLASDNVLTANYRSPQEGVAAFGQMTFPVTDRFRLTGGLRWNDDKNNLKYRIVIYDVTEDGAYAADYYNQTTEINGRHQYDSGIVKYTVESSPVTYKGGFEYDIDDTKMLYANVASGYKNGGLNIQGVTPPQEYDPEEVINYSIGIKGRFQDSRLQLNAEAYYYDYQGMQQQCQVSGIYDPVRGEETEAMIIVNADDGVSAGMEVSMDWMLTANDIMSASVSYMNTEFGHLILPSSPFYEYETDKTGDDLPKAPTLSGTFSIEHVFALPDGGSVTPKFQTKISDGFYNTHETYLAGSYTEAYMMSDFYLAHTSPSGQYTTTLWVKNLENADVTDYVFPMYRRILMEPRTAGITFSARF